MVVGFGLEVADWTCVIFCETEAFEAGLCGELVMVVIPHQLPIAAPNFRHPSPDR